MGIQLELDKREKSKTRKLPFLLPRFGVYVDFAGYEVSCKYTSLLETAINLQERGLSVANIIKVNVEQFAEIRFPKKKKPRTIDTSAKTISVKIKK